MAAWRSDDPVALAVPTRTDDPTRVDYDAVSPEQGRRLIEVAKVCRESRRTAHNDCMCFCCQYARERYYRERRAEIQAAREAYGATDDSWWGEDNGGG